jgi:hypothetical protein
VRARDATKSRGQQLRQTPEQHLRAVGQRRCELAIAFKLLEQDFAVMFNEIHYSFPSTGGRVPAALKDVSIYLFRAHVIAPIVNAGSASLNFCCRRLCASDAEPGDNTGPNYGEVTNQFLLALHDQLRFAE